MSDETTKTYRHHVLRVQLFIEEHLDQELSLERLAQVAHVSPYHFHRIFKAIVGEGVAEHVRRLRLESAALQLKATGCTVLEIALGAGYGSHEAFSRSFKRHFGVSPTEFRHHEQFTLFSKEPQIMSFTANPTNISIETIGPKRVVFLRHVGSYFECGTTWGKLYAWAGPKGVLGPQTESIGICHDDPDVTEADKIRMDCCLTVADDFTGEGDVQVQTIEGGDFAILRHQGPYDGLHDAYRWLFGEWLSASGRELRDQPTFEIYRNSPQDTAPEDLLTEIHLPLKSRV